MKKIANIFPIWVLFWVSAVSAHGPSRVKVEESIIIKAPPAVVWAQIKDFAKVENWLPVVEKTSARGGNKKGATRELTLKDGGGTIKEELKKYKESKMEFSYKITEMRNCRYLSIPVVNQPPTTFFKFERPSLKTLVIAPIAASSFSSAGGLLFMYPR